MAIEQELEKLHANLKALGSAREKLDLVSGNISAVTESVAKAGESLKRLADMPELTERVQTSVDRLINASRDVEILNAVTMVNTGVQGVMTSIQSVANDVAHLSADVGSAAHSLDEQTDKIRTQIDSASEDLQSVRAKQTSTGKLIVLLLVLSMLQSAGIIALVLKML